MSPRPYAAALALWLLAGATVAAPAPPQPPEPPAEARARAEAAVVLLETYDADGEPGGYRSAFLAEPNWVITNWHCIEGASDAYVNLGERGLARVTGILADDPDHDFVILAADLPEGAGPPLPLTDARAAPGAPVWIAVRDRFGALTLSGGEALDEHDRYGVTLFESTARGWPGCSGSPWIDESGRAVAVVRGRGDYDEQRETYASAGIPAHIVRRARLAEARPLRDWWGAQVERKMPQVRAHADRARQAFHNEDYDAAAKEYRMALALMPEHRLSRHYLASALEEAGKADEAIAALREYTERFPATADIVRHIGNIHYRAERYGDARDAYTEAIAIEPSADLYFWLASALSDLGSDDEARAAYEKALALDPHHKEARIGLLAALSEAGENARVAAALAELTAAPSPDYDGIVSIAAGAVRAGHVHVAAAVADAIAPRNHYVANRIRSMIDLARAATSPVTPPHPTAP